MLLLAAIAIGCGPPPAPPKTTMRLEPGPVDADAPEEFQTTESGIKYRIRRKGNGKKPGPKDGVRIHYRGWLDSERAFDSSYGKRSSSYTVDGVVPGFGEALQMVDIGGMIEVEIPTELAYGELGNPPTVPPNATLHFLIEMEEITPGLPE